MIVAAWFVAALLSVVAWALSRYAKKNRCSNPECRRAAWWRVFVVVRASGGARPKVLARLSSPFRVCGQCFADLDPRTAILGRPLRLEVKKTTLRVHGEAPDWNRTQVEREHVFAAWLRRAGK